MLIRMRELTIQALNDTNTDDDKIKINNEIDQLLESIEMLAKTVNFNTRTLLDGSFSRTMSRVAGAIRDFDETRLHKTVHQYGASFDCVGITAMQFGDAIVYPPARLPDEYGMRHTFPVHSEIDSIVFSRVGDGVFNAVYMNGSVEYRATFHRGDAFIHLLHEPSGNMFTMAADSIITESLDAADGSQRIIVPVQTSAFEPAQLVINRHPTAFEREIPLQSPQSLGFVNMPDKTPTTAGLNASGVYKLDRTNIVVPDLDDIGFDPLTVPITLHNHSALRQSGSFQIFRTNALSPADIGVGEAEAIGFALNQNIEINARREAGGQLAFSITGSAANGGVYIHGFPLRQETDDFTVTQSGGRVTFTHTASGAVLSFDMGSLGRYLDTVGDDSDFNINISNTGNASVGSWVSSSLTVGNVTARANNIDRHQEINITAQNIGGTLSFAITGNVRIDGTARPASEFTHVYNPATQTVTFTHNTLPGHNITFNLGDLSKILTANGDSAAFTYVVGGKSDALTGSGGVGSLYVSDIDPNQNISINASNTGGVLTFDIDGTVLIGGVPYNDSDFTQAIVGNELTLTHTVNGAYMLFRIDSFSGELDDPGDSHDFTFDTGSAILSEIRIAPDGMGIGNATATKIDYPQAFRINASNIGSNLNFTLAGDGPGGTISVNGVYVNPATFTSSRTGDTVTFNHPNGAIITFDVGDQINRFLSQPGDNGSIEIEIDNAGAVTVNGWVNPPHRPTITSVPTAQRVTLGSVTIPEELRLLENGSAELRFNRVGEGVYGAVLTLACGTEYTQPVTMPTPPATGGTLIFADIYGSGHDITIHINGLTNLNNALLFNGDSLHMGLNQQRGIFSTPAPQSDIQVVAQRVNGQLHFSTQMIIDITDANGVTTTPAAPVTLAGRLVTSVPGNNQLVFSHGGRDHVSFNIGYEDFSTLGSYIQFHCGEGGTVNPTSTVNGDRYTFTFQINNANGIDAGINLGSMTHNLHRVMATDDLTANGFLPTGVRITNIQMDPLYRVVFGLGDAPDLVFENDGGAINGTLTINGVLPPHNIFRASNITGNVVTFRNDRNHQITVTLADFASFRDDKLRHEGSEFTTTLPRTPGIHQIDPNQRNLPMTVERLPDGRFEYTVEMLVNGYMRTLKGTAQPGAEVVNFSYHGSAEGAMPINRSRLPVPPTFLLSMNIKPDTYGFNEDPLERYLRRPGDIYTFTVNIGANRNATMGGALAEPHTRANPTFNAGQGPLSGIRFELDNRVWFFNDPLNIPAPVLSVSRGEDSYAFTMELEDRVYTSQAFNAFPPVSPESPGVVLRTGDTDSDAQRDGVITMHDIDWDEVAFHLAFQGDALQTRLTQAARQLLPRIEVNGEIEGTRLVDSTLYGNGAHEGMRALGLGNTIVHSGHFISGVDSPLGIRFDKVGVNAYHIHADVNGFSVSQSFTPGIDEEIRLDFGEGRVISVPLGDLEHFDFSNAAVRNLRYVESLGVFCFEDAVVERNGQPLWIHVGANANQGVRLDIGNLSIHHLGGETALAAINVTTREGGNNALMTIDNALSEVSGMRASLGAFQNRLEFTAHSTGITSDNLSSALSRIMDADIAHEMAMFSQAGVIEQAAMMMLAQANQQPNAVMRLLQ
jgi:flagellin-like hook-associated protein FlgL